MPARSSIVAALPTSDLRSHSREARRDRTSKAKWARGGRPAPGKSCPHNTFETCDCAARPTIHGQYINSASQRREVSHNWGKFVKGDKAAMRLDIGDELATTTSDSSADEEVKDASAAPEPDIMYSFDARKGPGRGSEILSQAITKAVERFENKETEQLVSQEYDVIDGYEKEKEVGGGYDADEDEYEMIDKEGIA